MSTDVKKRFDLSAKMIKILNDGPSNYELLKLYALYKQSTIGDCNISQPSTLNLKESAKWNAWNKIKGMSRVDAMNKYSDLVLLLLDTYKTK